MVEQLAIEGGPIVRLEGQPAQGTRHELHFGVLTSTGEPVVVKLERMPGSLAGEQHALAWLGAEGGLAPRLHAAGTTVADGQRVACLVIERRPGAPPTTTDGWRRMGGALASLGDLPHSGSDLTSLDPTTFGRRHAERVHELGARLAPLATSIPDWGQLASPELPAPNPLVLAHGDPGPGNYLDDGDDDGTLIDWEDAHIAPRGLDLARLVFIALLGAGPSGYPVADHRSRARAAIDGYLAALHDRWRPTAAESRWWTTVAGVQFIHRRWRLGGRPAPWEDAMSALHAALTTDDGIWSAG